MSLNLLVAYDKNNGIGKDNGIPWRISEDLRHFKEINESVVSMGRKTWVHFQILINHYLLELVVITK